MPAGARKRNKHNTNKTSLATRRSARLAKLPKGSETSSPTQTLYSQGKDTTTSNCLQSKCRSEDDFIFKENPSSNDLSSKLSPPQATAHNQAAAKPDHGLELSTGSYLSLINSNLSLINPLDSNTMSSSDSTLLLALQQQMEANNNALKLTINDSIKESSVNLRLELKADMNAIFEQHKLEWSSFQDSINRKVMNLEESLARNKLESEKQIAALKDQINDLSLSLDKDKLGMIKSLDTDDLNALKFHKVDISNLKQRVESGEKKISDVTESLQFNSNQSSDLKTDLNLLRDDGLNRDSRIHMLEVNQSRANNEINELQGSAEASEIRQRKFNLVFEGITESDNENTKQVIVDLPRKSSLATPPTKDQIDTAYRLGRKNEGFSCSVLVVFKDLHVKDNVLNNAPQIRKSLESKTLWINRDHPELTRKQISNTRKCYNLMKANNHQCKVHGTSITFNNQIYHYKDLNNLPEGSRLEDTKLIPCSDGKGLCFQGELCYVSNFYPATIYYKRNPFYNAEQAYQWDKAVSAGKFAKAKEILGTSNPLKAKQLGSEITPNEAWFQNREDILKSIVTLKFKQNKELGTRLKNSGYDHFYECTRDLKWGTGISLKSRQVDTSLFTGENRFGKILSEVKAAL